MIVLCKNPPDGAAVALDRCAVEARHAEAFQRNALAEQHAEDIVVRDDQQARRIGERLVEGIPARIGVAVRTDDRQVLYGGVECAGDRTHARLGREQQIGVDQCIHTGRAAPPSACNG
jgi:hypothetical protein